MNIFWPAVDTMEDAKKAINNGAGVAYFCAVVTGIVGVMAANGHQVLPGMGPGVLLDAALLTGIGTGIMFKSRIAALAGAIYYSLNAFYMLSSGGGFRFTTILFLLAFVGAVRGTFAYHELKKYESDSSGPSAPVISPVTGRPVTTPAYGGVAQGPASPAPQKRKASYLIPGILSFIALMIGGAWAAGARIHPEVFNAQGSNPLAASPSKRVRIEFVSGKVEEGEVVEEKDKSLLINIEGASLEFSRDEIKSMTPVNGEIKMPSARGAFLTFRPEDRLFSQTPAHSSAPHKAAVRTPAPAAAAVKTSPAAAAQALPSGLLKTSAGTQGQITAMLQQAEEAKARVEKEKKENLARARALDSQ